MSGFLLFWANSIKIQVKELKMDKTLFYEKKKESLKDFVKRAVEFLEISFPVQAVAYTMVPGSPMIKSRLELIDSIKDLQRILEKWEVASGVEPSVSAKFNPQGEPFIKFMGGSVWKTLMFKKMS
jgi:hypothetical protein